MFCRNCGKQLIGTPEICINCGAKPLAAASFCPACGTPTTTAAVYCVKCGAGLQITAASSTTGKSKIAAVLLAVFLGWWTWLYTYKKDAWKFWVGLGATIFCVVLAIATLGIFIAVACIILLGIRVWTIVDTATKSEQWYKSY